MSDSMQSQRLTTLNFRSGVITEQTPKAAEGQWTDADKVRFRFNKPELLGGWQNVTTPAKTAELLGTPRELETVRTLGGTHTALIGTNVGIFSSDLSEYNDVTPITTAVPASNPFSTSAGSTNVLVSVSIHGMTNGTYVVITSAQTTIGGNILIDTSAQAEAKFPITVVDNNSFTIDVGVTAAATSAQTGGNCTIKLYYKAGLQSSQAVGGWGTGAWGGNFGWNTAPDGTYTMMLREWSMDLWGTYVMAVPNLGPLFVWTAAAGIGTRFTVVTAAPSINQLVRVASEARHVILYGTHDISGQYDPLLIRWCSQEDYDDWTPSVTNTAGEIRLNSRGSQIITVVKMSDKMLVLTDTDIFLQNYIGSGDVFGFIRAGENCGAISQNCAVEYAGIAYWMSSNGQFFKYDGRLQPVPCAVLRYVFQNLNTAQTDKIICGTNSQFDEIIWFYPSTSSPDGENDRYVIYNTREDHWTIGSLARTTWRDRSTFAQPLATGVAGTGLYYHETGYTDDGTPMTAFVESAFFDTQDGDEIMFSNKFVPDLSDLSDGTPYSGSMTVYLQARKYPGADIVTKGPYNINGTTNKISTRLRGREFAVRFESRTVTDKPWRMGEFRMALEPDGKR